jgi:hypothetical protein
MSVRIVSRAGEGGVQRFTIILGGDPRCVESRVKPMVHQRRKYMKKFLFYVAAALFSGSLVTAAVAADGMKAAEKPKSEMGKMMGEHKMAGTVEKIDHKTGMMKVKTGMGDMELHFPPPSVKDLKEGDAITVQLGFTKGGGAMKGGEMKDGEMK